MISHVSGCVLYWHAKFDNYKNSDIWILEKAKSKSWI